jgi:hypothetical protein
MLHGYPLVATQDNWLHETITSKVRLALTELNSGSSITPWKVGLPLKLNRKRAIKLRFEKFVSVARGLDQHERLELLRLMDEQNNIPKLFSDLSKCEPITVDSLPPGVYTAVREIFESAFDLLTSLGIRDKQYLQIYESLSLKVCPFCGTEPFDAPGLVREDLDHYLFIASYPFLGVNLLNLTPMGGRCNSGYKHKKDILHDQAGSRRRCFDPYGNHSLEVSLIESRPFEGTAKNSMKLPLWDIRFNGSKDEVATWEDVFRIKERYEKSVLDAYFREWMVDFARWCKKEGLNVETRDRIVQAIDCYIDKILSQSAILNFLRKAVFQMLSHQCGVGDNPDRLVRWIQAMVSNSV